MPALYISHVTTASSTLWICFYVSNMGKVVSVSRDCYEDKVKFLLWTLLFSRVLTLLNPQKNLSSLLISSMTM